MRRIIRLGLFASIIICCSSSIPDPKDDKKEFEGTITYLTTLESKTTNISTEKLQSGYGDTMTIYIKNGNYKMTFNGTDIKEIYYLNSKNIQYTLRNGIDTLFITSCDNEPRQLVSSKFQYDANKILSRQCKVLINDLGGIKNYYWYDSTIFINPDRFIRHKLGYVNTYYGKAQSPWLKYKYEGRSFNLTHEAIEIKERKLNDQIFQPPNFPEYKLE